MPEFFIHIENGEITNTLTVNKAFKEIKKVDGWHKAKIESAKKRSNKQNRFYWLLMKDYIQPGLYDLGYRQIKTAEDAHFFCKNEFLKTTIVNEKTGEVKEHVGSTRKLSTIEWEAYREDLNQFASEYLGIILPDPNQQLEMEY